MTTKTAAEKKEKGTPSYEDFIASLHLQTINLKQSSSQVNREEYWKHKKKSVNYELIAKPIEKPADKYFDSEATLTVTLTGQNSDTPLLQIAATFDLHVHTDLASAEFVKKFCDSEIRLIVWPYFREFISSMTSRMYIPPLILPLSDKDED